MPFRNKSNGLQAALAASRNSSNTSNNSRRTNGDYSSANSTPHSSHNSTPQSATKTNPLAHQSTSSLAKSNGLSQPSQTSISSSAFSIPPDINDQIIQKLVNPNSKLNLEALIDAVTALYHDTNIPALKKDGKIAKFITSYETTIKNAIRERTKLADFEEIRLLGQGAFGEVKLVRHKPTKKVFAMKTLNKKYMVRKWLAESSANFMEERQILMNGAYCPWVIQLHYAFQDQRNLYMVMEFMAGGDLVKLVERFELPDNWVRFYAMEIILGIEAIHNMGYLHRDIKPDNILLDRTGHVKLADFGTCLKMDARKQVKFQRAVGTPDYVPPEMLSAEGRMESYGSESDWWSFGIVLYELIVGDVPFYSETLTGTYSKILHHQDNLEFPEEVPITNNARAFILTLITDKRERNGRNCDCSGIKNHKWFTDAKDDWNWDNIREHPAVVIPELTTDVDTKYFDAIEPNQDRSNYDDTFGEVTTFEGHQLPFIGFSYCTIPDYENFAIKNQQDLMGSKSRSVSNGSSLNLNNRPLVPPKPEIDAGEVVKLKEHVKEHQKALQNERVQTVSLKSQMAAQKREHEIQLKSMENQWKRNTRTLTMQSGINDNEGFQALKQELNEISDKLVKAEAEKRKESERAAILQRDRDAEQTAKQGLENQLQKTKQNIQQLNRKLEDSETLLVERSEKYKVAERQLRAAEQNIHTLKTQLVEEHGNRVRVRENMDSELKNQADELNLLKIEVQNSEKTKLKKENEKQTLEHQIEELRKVNANIQVEQRRSQNASVNELERKLTETIRALSLKKSELDMATRKFEDQQNDFLRKVREIEELKRQRTRDENKVRELQVSITEKEQKIAQLATDFDQKQQEFNGLKKDNADMVEQLQNSKKQLREQQSQMRELTDQLDAEHYFLTLYKSQIRDLESDKAEWERQKGDLEAELHSVKEER
jgi:serine/threonine protein kinase